MKPHDPLRPLGVMFLHTSFVVGGAESLMANLIRRLDRARFAPEVCCLKGLGPVGEVLSKETPAFEGLLSHKYDLGVLPRLVSLFRRRRVDAVISVGAGDKMFWGRLAARLARVPVVICGIHSTGWPDRIGRLNRMLTPITDMFVAVAAPHGRYLVDDEGFPPERVCVIPNGVDVDEFRPRQPDPVIRQQLGLGPGPVAGTVARLSAEKNIEMFLDVAARAKRGAPSAQFLVVGDGPCREALCARAAGLGLSDSVRFLGARNDVSDLLPLVDVFLLTSHVEANPVSILEALATGVPVVATRVGSVPETVREGVGFLVHPGDAEKMAEKLVHLFRHPEIGRAMGRAGREMVVRHWSVPQMVEQYQDLIEKIYARKTGCQRRPLPPPGAPSPPTPLPQGERGEERNPQGERGNLDLSQGERGDSELALRGDPLEEAEPIGACHVASE